MADGGGQTHAQAVRRAADTYGAAADHYDRDTLAFWRRYGELTIARLGPVPGRRVLDLCCGSGESALAAARAVGPDGSVLGIDVAEPMLALARRKAAAAGLGNVEFRAADATATRLPDDAFDLVVCVFGVFFVPDQAAFVGEMWRLVAVGGELALTTWGPGVFEPGNGEFWRAVDAETEPAARFNPWDDITTPAALAALMTAGGVPNPQVEAVTGRQPLAGPEAFWDIVLGTGYRSTVDRMIAPARERLRDRLLARLRALDVTEVRTDAVLGHARKSSG